MTTTVCDKCLPRALDKKISESVEGFKAFVSVIKYDEPYCNCEFCDGLATYLICTAWKSEMPE